MCGIIAGVSVQAGLGLQIAQGLSRLEYRGYDSFGISYKERHGSWKEIKKIGAPSEWTQRQEISGDLSCAIGHTRWATHGAVTLKNAHPHNWEIGNVALSLVHNGVVENLAHIDNLLSREIRSQLKSETDSEQILALIVQNIESGHSTIDAIALAVEEIEGSYALIIADLNRNMMWAVKKDLPLYTSQLTESCFIVSDLAALPSAAISAYAIQDNEILCISENRVFSSLTKEPPVQNIEVAAFPVVATLESTIETAPVSHLEREIGEQRFLLPSLLELEKISLPSDLKEIHLIGCGSSFYAAQFCAQLFVQNGVCSATAFIASEFRDLPPLCTEKTLLIAISQSGETADVLGALRDFGHRYYKKIALCNRPRAMIESLVDYTYPLQAGPEYSVASTKAFTAQLVQLSRFCPNEKNAISFLKHQMNLSSVIHSPVWKEWAQHFQSTASLLILARGMLLPIAHEGALKLRELTYKQTQSMASGELKHGSLALIDSESTVILCAPSDRILHKHLVAAQEVHARGGRLWVLLQEGVDPSVLPPGTRYVHLPAGDAVETALYYTIPFQILALELAKLLENPIDRPRNLAKSVTVE